MTLTTHPRLLRLITSFSPRGLQVGLFVALALMACGKTPQDVRSPEETQATESSLADTGATAAERAILAHVETLPPHQPTKVQSVTVTVGDLYNAASGHVCREVTLSGGAQPNQRLACKEGDAWFFTAGVWDSQASDSPQGATTSPVGGSPTRKP